MPQELLTYAGLAQRLNISIAAAKGLAKGLQLTRYAGPDGKTLLLVDMTRLRSAVAAADDDAEDEPVRLTRRAAREPVVDEPARLKHRNAREAVDDDADDVEIEPRRQRRPAPRRAARAQMVASLHERIEEIQRQLDRVEDTSGEEMMEGPDRRVLAELYKIASDARDTAEQTREELAAYRSRRWWKRSA